MDESSTPASIPTTIVPPSAWVRAGVIVALCFALVGFFAPNVAPHDPYVTNVDSIFTRPGTTWTYPLGTDHIGRDVLSRLIYSFRPLIISGPLALVLGTIAAVLLVTFRTESDQDSALRRLPPGGVLENSVGRLSIVIIFGGPIPLIAVMAVLGSSILNVVVPTAILASILPMSLVYQVVRKTIEDQADRGQQPSGGASNQPSPFRLALRAGVVLAPVTFSLTVLMTLLLESILSFLGVGIPPDIPSLGGMLSSSTRYAASFWIWIAPMGVITIAAGALVAVTIPVSRVQQTFKVEVERPTEGMEYAGTWLRLGSIVVDTLGLILLSVIFVFLLEAAGVPDFLVIVVLYVTFILYSVVYLGGWKQSMGNRLFRIKVVTAHGGSVAIWRSVLRALVMGIPPAYLLIPFNRRRRALYDVLAGTAVIKLPPKP